MVPNLSISSLLAFALLLLALTACAENEWAENEYQQPELAPEKVATLEKTSVYDVYVYDIDGKFWPFWGAKPIHQYLRIKILPGPHSVDDINFVAEAGHTYIIGATWDEDVYRKWIEEAKTGTVLGTNTFKLKEFNYNRFMPNDHPPPYPKFTTTDQRAYDVIAVRSEPYDPNADWPEPLRGAGSGAAGGAATGATVWSRICLSQAWPGKQVAQNMAPDMDPDMGGAGGGAASILCLLATPVAALVGAIAGAGIIHSDEEVTAATAALKEALLAANPYEGVERAVIEQLRKAHSGRYEVRPLSNRDAGLSHEELAGKGIDAVLELQVVVLELRVPPESLDPDAQFYVQTRARLTDTNLGPTRQNHSWAYLSSPYDYFDLAANDARLLRHSIEQGYSEIADLIVADLFE